MKTFVIAAALGALLSGCTSIQAEHNDWSTYSGVGAEHFRREEVQLSHVKDPAEPTNRGVWAFNKGFFNHVGRPIASGWRAILPGPVRRGLHNAGRNLLYPVRLVNNVLQGKAKGALDETGRFVINSTFGFGGVVDRMGDVPPPSNEDFGQTFEKAGWSESSFVVLPILGPSTARDSVGRLLDSVFDPATYFFPAAPVRNVNDATDPVLAYRRLEASTYDLYYLAQQLTTLRRDIDIEDYVHLEEDCEHCVATETIQAIFLTFEDRKFPTLGEDRTVRLASTERELPYTLFLQPEPAPIIYILPGLGGHRISDSTLGLAEMVYERGFSAVTISNAMNFEFIANASTVDLPGFAPVDARDVHAALDAIHVDVEGTCADRVTSRVLMGLSLGAFHTLFIAAAERDPDNALIGSDRYIAINPPVRMEYGLHQLDGYFNAPLDTPPERRQGMILHTLRKALDLGQNTISPAGGLPFTEQEAQFLIGLSFRATLQSVIFQTQLRRNMGVLKTRLAANQRSPAYAEIAEFSFIEYFYAFILPYYAEHREDVTLDEAGVRRLFELSDLHSIEDQLRGSDRIHLLTNEDDFLLERRDLEWLGSVFGTERCHHFEHGGHLGNLYMPEVQEEVMTPLLDLVMPR